jgi:6,7-dimethyl-8-ribityllumazine synthase
MQIIEAKKITEQFNIALVVSRFNDDITYRLYEGAIQRLRELDFPAENITVLWTPGAVELPLAAQRLASTDRYAAIICLGAVIRGETNHYDYVCQQVSYGCQKVALENDIPVIFGVLTTENEEQALERVGGQHGHKGWDAVDAALEMVSVLRQAAK